MGDDPELYYKRRDALVEKIKNEMKHLDVLKKFKLRHDTHLSSIGEKAQKEMSSKESAACKSYWKKKKELDAAENTVVSKSKALIEKASLVSSDIGQAFASESGKFLI